MIRRKFIPGSRWLYFKIYTGIKTADEVATRTLLPLLRELYEAKLIDDWFFIRYTDPDFHLRLRLLVARPEHYAAIFARIGSSVEPLVDNGAVVKVVCDTYVREIERYGAGTMEAVERLFGIDSRAVLELLDRVAEEPADRRETVRWQLALLLPAVMGETGVMWAEVLAWLGADLILAPSYFYVMNRTRRETEEEKA